MTVDCCLSDVAILALAIQRTLRNASPLNGQIYGPIRTRNPQDTPLPPTTNVADTQPSLGERDSRCCCDVRRNGDGCDRARSAKEDANWTPGADVPRPATCAKRVAISSGICKSASHPCARADCEGRDMAGQSLNNEKHLISTRVPKL